jgi:hypothetical protein
MSPATPDTGMTGGILARRAPESEELKEPGLSPMERRFGDAARRDAGAFCEAIAPPLQPVSAHGKWHICKRQKTHLQRGFDENEK